MEGQGRFSVRKINTRGFINFIRQMDGRFRLHCSPRPSDPMHLMDGRVLTHFRTSNKAGTTVLNKVILTCYLVNIASMVACSTKQLIEDSMALRASGQCPWAHIFRGPSFTIQDNLEKAQIATQNIFAQGPKGSQSNSGTKK